MHGNNRIISVVYGHNPGCGLKGAVAIPLSWFWWGETEDWRRRIHLYAVSASVGGRRSILPFSLETWKLYAIDEC